MRAANLPSLRGLITNGALLRLQLAKAVGSVEVYANRGSVEPASADALKAFLTAGIAAVDEVLTRPASIVITPTTVTLTVAAPTQQLVVTKTTLAAASVVVTPAASGTTYVSSDPTKATVSAAGLVTRVANGTTTITAKNGSKSDTQLVTVTA